MRPRSSRAVAHTGPTVSDGPPSLPEPRLQGGPTGGPASFTRGWAVCAVATGMGFGALIYKDACGVDPSTREDRRRLGCCAPTSGWNAAPAGVHGTASMSSFDQSAHQVDNRQVLVAHVSLAQ